MPKILRPLDVYKELPGTNCGECGEINCMAFAAKLIERVASVDNCPPLFKNEYTSKFKSLLAILRPPVKEVVIGKGESALKIGGKVCVYRHELTWYHQTAIAVDVSDEMAEDVLLKRVKAVDDFLIERIGMNLKLNMVAIRSTSGNPEIFAKAVNKVCENTNLPIILCSYDANVVEEALLVSSQFNPLIYAATEKNWKEFAQLAKKYKCPLAVSAPGDVNLLKSLAKALRNFGLDDLVLDPGTYMVNDAFDETVNILTMLRRAAIEKEDKDLGYPLMAVPASIWISPEKDEVATKMREAYLACSLITRYADLLIMHSIDPWVVLPLVVGRQSLYTDPRVPLSIAAKLYDVNEPDEKSPLYITGNSALTYFLVKNDIESSGKGWLLCVDTGGISLQSSVAGKRFTSDMIAEAVKEFDISSKIKHNSIILPGYAARLSGELEDALQGWKVFIGPRESSSIPKYLADVWQKEVNI